MRFIICDDHPIVVMSTTMLLQAHGHEVVATAPRPQVLRSQVERHRPDVCVVDLLFGPVTDSVAALVAIKDVAELTSVIVVSGSADAVQREAAMAAGASAVASKSLPAAELVALLERRGQVAASPKPRAASRDNPYSLTAREQQVLACLAQGISTPGIAERLDMRGATARSHVRSLMLKMGVHTRAAAVARGVSEGFAHAS
ncbi:MAG TPA: response regulator transcription factor [Aquihabitans sp.]|nr:response regulator transcription factor [Aquihabitans sp.]